jgi:hypothetical protein
MTNLRRNKVPWAPAADDELSWLPIKGRLPLFPRPLEYTIEVEAFGFGVTRALESLEFPLTEVRSRLLDGQIYLAIAPTANAEQNAPQRLRRIWDLNLRYTKNIRDHWHQQVQPKVDGYNRWMAEFIPPDCTAKELAEQVRQLRWVRANQWFNIVRPVVAPTALVQRRANETVKERGHNSTEAQSWIRAADDGLAVTKEALGVLNKGNTVMLSGLRQIGVRIRDAGSIDNPEDIFWLQWKELRGIIQDGSKCQERVAERQKKASPLGRQELPASIGPALPADAARMYLINDILGLLS